MSIDIILQTTFPKYKIYDASNKKYSQIIKLIDLCNKLKNIIVYLIRNDINSKFLDVYEVTYQLNKKVNSLFFHNDDFLFFDNEKSPEGQVRFLKRFIEDKCECCICYKDFAGKYNDINICEKCGYGCCLSCIYKVIDNEKDLLCPVRRSSLVAYFT